MLRSKFSLAFLFLLLVPGFSLTQEREKILVAKTFKNTTGETLPYRLFIPANYDQKKKYPLVLYLHGGGGRGDDNRKQIDGGNGYLIDLFTGDAAQARYPSIVVAPQSPDEGWIANYQSVTPTKYLHLVNELLAELQKTYSIDGARLYVAGQSMGGFGTFAIIAEHPKMFAAGIPLCAGGDESKASQLRDTPIWAFHGAKDEAVLVERSRTIVAAITKAGGKAKYTEYPDIGHIIWPSVVKETELLPWLFSQKR